MGCLLAREIKNLKNTFQVNHSVIRIIGGFVSYMTYWKYRKIEKQYNYIGNIGGFVFYIGVIGNIGAITAISKYLLLHVSFFPVVYT
jgi:hypothetical protein